MNINDVKRKIQKLVNKKVIIKVNLGRNKHEKYIGVIEKVYFSIFTLKTETTLKSFSYADLLTKEIIISEL